MWYGQVQEVSRPRAQPCILETLSLPSFPLQWAQECCEPHWDVVGTRDTVAVSHERWRVLHKTWLLADRVAFDYLPPLLPLVWAAPSWAGQSPDLPADGSLAGSDGWSAVSPAQHGYGTAPFLSPFPQLVMDSVNTGLKNPEPSLWQTKKKGHLGRD